MPSLVEPLRLLYVDDDPSDAASLQTELRTHSQIPCDVTCVAHVNAAIAELQRKSFDAVLLDEKLPDADATNAYAALCQTARQLPVMMISEADDRGNVASAVAAGAHDMLVKGDFDGRTLVRRVRFAIERLRKSLASDGWPGDSGNGEQTAPPTATGDDAPIDGPPGTACHEEREQASSPPTAKQSLRALLIGLDPATENFLVHVCTGFWPESVDTQTACNAQAAQEILQREEFDTILVGVSMSGQTGVPEIAQIKTHAPKTPVLVISDEIDDDTSLKTLQQGADDVLIASELSGRTLARCIYLAIVRNVDQSLPSRWSRMSLSDSPLLSPAPPGMAERRQHPRYLVTRSATIIPIDSRGGPDNSNGADGFTIDISHEGIRLEIAGISQLASSRLVVGVEGDDGLMCYSAVEALHVAPSPAGLRVGGRFLSDHRNPLRDEDLAPALDPQTARLKTRLPAETLARWAGLGVISPVRLERVLVCPQCQGLPAVREGCRACGSADWWSKVLIHHFACAHVGYVEEFETERDLKCPKCRTAALVVGADFEYLQSPFQCRECGWSDTELELIGTCLSCRHRFPFCNACAEDFTIYHVNRLDPLAFITSS